MIRRTVLTAVAMAAVLCVSAGGALASNTTVTQAIKAQDKVVSANPTFQTLKHLKINTVAQAKALIPKLKKLEGVIDGAATAVSKASATAGQRAGKADWVLGDRMQGKGVGGLATALTDLVKHEKAAGKAELAKALKLVASGDKLTLKADKLLGLPSTD